LRFLAEKHHCRGVPGSVLEDRGFAGNQSDRTETEVVERGVLLEGSDKLARDAFVVKVFTSLVLFYAFIINYNRL